VCETCGHSKVACVCGLSYRERLLGVTVHGSALASRTKRRYYDIGGLDAQFGEDSATRRERYMEETRGLGIVKPLADGSLAHKNQRTGNVERLSEKQEREMALHLLGPDPLDDF
jgi:hypothetical protein